MGLLFGSSDEEFGVTEEIFEKTFNSFTYKGKQTFMFSVLHRYLKYRFDRLESLIKEEKLR
jgi:hypothetical protein